MRLYVSNPAQVVTGPARIFRQSEQAQRLPPCNVVQRARKAGVTAVRIVANEACSSKNGIKKTDDQRG